MVYALYLECCSPGPNSPLKITNEPGLPLHKAALPQPTTFPLDNTRYVRMLTELMERKKGWSLYCVTERKPYLNVWIIKDEEPEVKVSAQQPVQQPTEQLAQLLQQLLNQQQVQQPTPQSPQHPPQYPREDLRNRQSHYHQPPHYEHIPRHEDAGARY
ncbi:hypothetical protein HYFRA_00002291 [Hymenoscyphus fraxineus]|uniref:Uncharacterized protein n=1 Tax=Hymenoscyphus fraxineus TaxID=746836 RepID=A0A9N9PNF5_9HELO|nr:hypothetical protein HYFRA_00002291 [Hymenoscyphus fraxineus]